MAEQENNEVDEEKRARGGKRTFESKIAEVSTSKSKKHAKRALAETPDTGFGNYMFSRPFGSLVRSFTLFQVFPIFSGFY
jgi:hypothetical protein